MANEHTPGPWKVSKMGRSVLAGGTKINQSSGPGGQCAKVQQRQEEQARANALLISAAPDLLAALRQARDVLIAELGDSRYRVNFAYIEAAIAKASGDEQPHVLIRVTELEGM